MKTMRALALIAAISLAPAMAQGQAPIRSRTAASAPAASPAPARSTTTSSGGGGYAVSTPVRSRGYGGFGRGGFGSRMPTPVSPPPGVQGRVRVGGERPPMPINVQCNCAGSLFGLGYTDLRGGFYYPFHMLPYSYYRLRTCDLRLYSPGYWPLIVPFNTFMRSSPFRMADTGRLELVPYGDISGATVSITSLAAPKEAQKAYEKAVKKFADREYDEAVEKLDEAVGLHPEYAAAWTLLGQVRMAQRLFPAATAAFRKAIDADETYVAPYASLVRLLLQQDKTAEVYELSGRGLDLNPYDSDLKYARAVTALQMKDYEDARYFAQQLADSDEAAFFPDALFVQASAVKAQGDYESAARLFGEYYAGRSNSLSLRDRAARELSEARLAEYTLRAMRPALP